MCVFCMGVLSFCEFASFPFGFEGGIWNLIEIIPEYYISFQSISLFSELEIS